MKGKCNTQVLQSQGSLRATPAPELTEAGQKGAMADGHF